MFSPSDMLVTSSSAASAIFGEQKSVETIRGNTAAVFLVATLMKFLRFVPPSDEIERGVTKELQTRRKQKTLATSIASLDCWAMLLDFLLGYLMYSGVSG